MLKDLTYKVIVIDDDTDLYEDYVEFMEKRLTTEGYRLEHERFEELSELDEKPIHDVDLFLVDLKFGNEDRGPEFIKKIRENHLTDILFYSSDATSILSNKASGKFEGVFFAVRDEHKKEILPMIDKLIGKMIKRSNTPLASRGIVLGCVAELDNIVKQKVAKLLAVLNQEQRDKIIGKSLKIYYDSYKGQSGKINGFWGFDFHKGMRDWQEVKEGCKVDKLDELVNTVAITDSNKNFHVLLEIYRCINGKDETYKAIKDFVNLLDDRNIFAHVQEEFNADGFYQFKRLKDEEYLVLTEEKCRELRNALINYSAHIDSI